MKLKLCINNWVDTVLYFGSFKSFYDQDLLFEILIERTSSYFPSASSLHTEILLLTINDCS